MKKLVFIITAILISSGMINSCANDDDICTSGEATPRLKMKFKSQSTGKLITLDSLFLAADYGNGPITLVAGNPQVDSVLIPLRVDDQSFTDLFIKTASAGSTSQLRINYETRNEYVSPACGIKRLYNNINPQLLQPTPVKGAEKNLNEITDEAKTHLYLLF